MPIYQVIICIAILLVLGSLFLHLLFNPITWVVVGILMIYSFIKRQSYMKELDDFNKAKQKEFEEKKAAYESGEAYRQGDENIFDASYVEREE